MLFLLLLGTWYDVGLGSCGTTNSNSELVAALNYIQIENGANPNNNPKCGDKIDINGPNGSSVTVTIVDTVCSLNFLAFLLHF